MRSIGLDKLESKSDKCIFMRYQKVIIRYQLYSPTAKKVFVLRYVIFLEKEFILRKGKWSKLELKEVQETTYIIHQVDEHESKPT